jgi:hypothetical protein
MRQKKRKSWQIWPDFHSTVPQMGRIILEVMELQIYRAPLG